MTIGTRSLGEPVLRGAHRWFSRRIYENSLNFEACYEAVTWIDCRNRVVVKIEACSGSGKSGARYDVKDPLPGGPQNCPTFDFDSHQRDGRVIHVANGGLD